MCSEPGQCSLAHSTISLRDKRGAVLGGLSHVAAFDWDTLRAALLAAGFAPARVRRFAPGEGFADTHLEGGQLVVEAVRADDDDAPCSL